MRAFAFAAVAGGVLALSACSGSSTTKNAATTRPTAPPAQTAVIRETTPDAAAVLGTPALPSADVTDIVDQVKIRLAELPREYSYGPFSTYQPNEAAVQGYDNPAGVLDQMRKTGREGGFVQSLTDTDGPGGAFTIDVWKDAAGAIAFFDQYPKPPGSLVHQEITLAQPLGEQSFAYQYQMSGRTGYVLSWRRGRLILGIGLQYFPGKESLDKITALAAQLDKKAQAAKQ